MSYGAIAAIFFGSFFGFIFFCALVIYLCKRGCERGCQCESNYNYSSNSTRIAISRIEMPSLVTAVDTPLDTPLDTPPPYSLPMNPATESAPQYSHSQGIPLHSVEYSDSQGVLVSGEPVKGVPVC